MTLPLGSRRRDVRCLVVGAAIFLGAGCGTGPPATGEPLFVDNETTLHVSV